eukprot:2007784-Amphidinium_carterae.1
MQSCGDKKQNETTSRHNASVTFVSMAIHMLKRVWFLWKRFAREIPQPPKPRKPPKMKDTQK